MFEEKRLVPKLYICILLEALGYFQEGPGFYWVTDEKNTLFGLSFTTDNKYYQIMDGSGYTLTLPVYRVKAPTLSELWNYLPRYIDISKDYVVKNPTDATGGTHIEEIWDGNVVDAVARMFVWLGRNRHFSFAEDGMVDTLEV